MSPADTCPTTMLEAALVSFIMCFVTRPHCVRLDVIECDGNNLLVDLVVHPEDVGRVKGRGQDRLRLIHKIAGEIAKRHRMRLRSIEIIDDDIGPEPEVCYAQITPTVAQETPLPQKRGRVRLVRPEQPEAA